MNRYFCLAFVALAVWFEGTTQAKEHVFIADPAKPFLEREAVVILPGLSNLYLGTKNIQRVFWKNGFDVFVFDYSYSASLYGNVKLFDQFFETYQLKNYAKVHVISFLLGSWVLNPWINLHPHNNISTILYDRSPTQERIPTLTVKMMPFLNLILMGTLLLQFEETPYPPIANGPINIGLIIENKATRLARQFKSSVLAMGPLTWDENQLHQDYDDFMHVWLNHDQMYVGFEVLESEVMHFIRQGRFSDLARRRQFQGDHFSLPYPE